MLRVRDISSPGISTGFIVNHGMTHQHTTRRTSLGKIVMVVGNTDTLISIKYIIYQLTNHRMISVQSKAIFGYIRNFDPRHQLFRRR